MQHIGDARIEIDDVMAPPPGETAETARPTVARQRRHRGWLAAAAVVAAAGAAAGTTLSFRYWASTPAASDPTGIVRSLIPAAPADALTPLPTRPALILSPDGKRLVFSAINGDRQQLYMRWLDSLEAAPIPGTENSNSPFFSPDGEWIGFWSGVLSPGAVGVLKKVPLSGGPPEELCKTGPLFGASWGSDNRIVFANATGGLLRVSAAAGSEPEPFTTLDLEAGEVSHRLPHVWPDGEGLFFTVLKRLGQFDEAIVVALSLATSDRRVIVSQGADARYVLTGHVLFVRRGTLIAAPFDPARLEVTGPSRAVLDGVMHAVNTGMTTLTDTGVAQFSVSRSGALLYVPGGIFSGVQRTLFWRDRNGAATPVATPPIAGTGPRFSPDGHRLLIHGSERGAGRPSIYDRRRGVVTPLTVGGGWPIWTPDGTRVTIGVTEPYGIGLIPQDGGALERLTVGPEQYPGSWSPDGQLLAFVKLSSTGGWEIWIHSRAGERRLRPSGSLPAVERYPAFSPDGRWLAYVTDESGHDEVWVTPYPGSAKQYKVSTEGGFEPAWAPNGRELFYIVVVAGTNLARMMAVDVSPDPNFTAGTPRMLFEAPYTISTPFRGYDVTPNGKQFVMSQRADPVPGPALTHMIFVQNWTEELKRLVPTR